MGNKWIVDVLTDLQSFADLNAMPHLADHLAQAAQIARLETAAIPQSGPQGLGGDTGEAGTISKGSGTSLGA